MAKCQMNTGKTLSPSEKLIFPMGFGEIKIGDDYDAVKKYCEKMNYRCRQVGGKEIQEDAEIGRASCRERVCRAVEVLGVGGAV